MKFNNRLAGCFGACVLLMCATAQHVLAGNQLINGSFESVGPDGPSTSFTGVSGGGHSAADGWGVFNNTRGTTTTELIASTLSGGGEFMIHVKTDGGANGLGQLFGTFGEGPACVTSSAWIFVVSGSAFIGAGNGGATGPNAFTTTTGEWEFIQGQNTVCPANNFIIYSNFGAGAEFYVDLASVVIEECIGPPGDINMDGFVDATDLALLLGAWGVCPPGPPCLADLAFDGIVNAADLAILLGNWGCQPTS